ncbi:uncharacterized protein LOC126903625 [Daktulosphaira vitifoliae]|uniref:uncharacterized protein LOC126903625 n=1 Tax=Daktulosphaira vitifoliae TaxID=58002 RepID=UPI0021A9912A|nr:uncharacterized protein LOC126903625 [Daktulosphaira vitifoliae]
MNLIIIFSIFMTLYSSSDSSCSNVPTENLVPTEEVLDSVIRRSVWSSFTRTSFYMDYNGEKYNFSMYYVEQLRFDLKYEQGGIILNSIYVCLIEQLYKKCLNAANHYKNNLINHEDKLKGLHEVWSSITMLEPLLDHMINALKFFNYKEKAVLNNLGKLKNSINEITVKNELSEDEINEKFEKILEVVTFENSLKEFKNNHIIVYENATELIITNFINSLCGVRSYIILDEQFINPKQANIQEIIENGIKAFYFDFGFRYEMLHQTNHRNLESK